MEKVKNLEEVRVATLLFAIVIAEAQRIGNRTGEEAREKIIEWLNMPRPPNTVYMTIGDLYNITDF